MSENAACCTPDTNLPEVARAMIDCDCGLEASQRARALRVALGDPRPGAAAGRPG